MGDLHPFMKDTYPRAAGAPDEQVITTWLVGQTPRQFSAAHVANLQARFASVPIKFDPTGGSNPMIHHLHVSNGEEIDLDTYEGSYSSAAVWEGAHVGALQQLLIDNPPDIG